MRPDDRNVRIQPLVTDEERVIAGDEHWVVLYRADMTYLAVWVDEVGELHTAVRKTANGAIKLASNSWGR